MESMDIAKNFELLTVKDNQTAYRALQVLREMSEKTDLVYAYMDKLGEMLDSPNSYVRTRGLILIACNAKWDVEFKIDELIDKYLTHITDKKPITARQCIKCLPVIAKSKPQLREDIIAVLNHADVSIYADSMQPLVYKDIHESLQMLQSDVSSI
ncbi:MAG: SufBD protein [Lachnospiraceae bacterium]|jgi:hypothetical protein|nr:SufBD protein [Lachnospiraceae bacterium]